MDKRYSKKRERIKECLKGTKEHPSAEWIYNTLKPEMPDLSLGTVYRNLNELRETGEIISVAVVLDKERFDATTEPHTHAICERCGKIIDVDDVTIPEELLEKAKTVTGFTVLSSKLQFIGLCEECKKKEKA